MTDLTKKDREILALRAARMSTGTIASLVGRSEAKVYNRLGELGVTTSAQAVALLASAALPDLSGWARIGGPEFSALLSFATVSFESATANFHRVNPPIIESVIAPPAPKPAKVERQSKATAPPRSAPPSPSTCAPGSSGKSPSPVTPTATTAAASPRRREPEPVRAIPSPRTTVSTQPLPRAVVVAIRPVSDRIAAWAGHFLRARWPLEEVADLFNVAEVDLATALGQAA